MNRFIAELSQAIISGFVFFKILSKKMFEILFFIKMYILELCSLYGSSVRIGLTFALHNWDTEFEFRLFMWVSWWSKWSLSRFTSGFLPFSPATNYIPSFLHTHLIHFVSFHSIRSFDNASGVVGRHPCYSQTFNKGASSHLIPRPGPGPVSDSS